MARANVTLNTDGGARGNPGPAGIGCVITDEAGAVIKTFGGYIGEGTNNVAEYRALVRGLELAAELGAARVAVRMDSELIVRQLTGVYRIKDPKLKALAAEVGRLASRFDSVSFSHVRREENSAADELVNRAIDAALGKS